jgi:hypothetical protein
MTMHGMVEIIWCIGAVLATLVDRRVVVNLRQARQLLIPSPTSASNGAARSLTVSG